jgi:hypothetical protein
VNPRGKLLFDCEIDFPAGGYLLALGNHFSNAWPVFSPQKQSL